MSLFDSEISKSIWNGKIPIKISLDPTETDVYGIEKTWDPIYLEVPRCSYLPLITKQIQQTLTSLGMKVSEEAFASVWYQDSNRQPLKWHYPIGLLYDLYSNLESLPWSLILCFKNLPTDILLLKPTPETMQDMFMSMVKEADFLRNGTTKKVMNLSKRDQSRLWQSLASDRYDDFWTVNRQLVEFSNNNLRNIPFRIYLPDNCPIIQELVSFYGDSEKEAIPTMEDILRKAVPELLEEETLKSITVIVHGIEIPLDTPMNWAYENLSFADNFLHIVISSKKST
ncbi:autophagy protein Apg5-domain-containing protein [Helicostylum pulchrum]|nr:autophagy protein Apg5-domain-containing protein [Helicostylum pulchrum]